MTEDEFYQLKIGNIIFRKSTETVAELSSQWPSNHKRTETDRLWANRTIPDTGADQSIRVSECDDWKLPIGLDAFKGYPFAYGNFLAMQLEDMRSALRQRTIL